MSGLKPSAERDGVIVGGDGEPPALPLRQDTLSNAWDVMWKRGKSRLTDQVATSVAPTKKHQIIRKGQPMHRTPVISEALRSIGYDHEVSILEIEFVSGNIYRYFNVPNELHAGLMTAASHGEFFTAHVRDAGFDYEEVT